VLVLDGKSPTEKKDESKSFSCPTKSEAEAKLEKEESTEWARSAF